MPYNIKDPKRDPNFDNHPYRKYTFVYLFLGVLTGLRVLGRAGLWGSEPILYRGPKVAGGFRVWGLECRV